MTLGRSYWAVNGNISRSDRAGRCGRYRIRLQSPDCLARGHGGPQDPDRLCTAALVTAKLGGPGIRRSEQVLRTVPTREGERTAIDTLVRAERPA